MMRIPAFALVLIAASFGSTPAAAQDAYPSRTIRLIVPYPPGAVTDAMSRPVAAELGKVLGQTVIIENKPGAGTLVGTQAVKRRRPTATRCSIRRAASSPISTR